MCRCVLLLTSYFLLYFLSAEEAYEEFCYLEEQCSESYAEEGHAVVGHKEIECYGSYESKHEEGVENVADALGACWVMRFLLGSVPSAALAAFFFFKCLGYDAVYVVGLHGIFFKNEKIK